MEKRNRLKIPLKSIVLLFGVLFILTNCQYDDTVGDINGTQDQVKSKIPFKLKEKTFAELHDDSRFVGAVNHVFSKGKANANFNARTVMEEQYGFTIDSTLIKEISTEGYTSYTFFIRRDTISDNFIENLVVEIDSTNIPKAYIIKYVLNSESRYIADDKAYILDAETEITPIEYNNSQLKTTYDSYGCVITLMCPWKGDHPAGDACIAADRGDLYWSDPECPEFPTSSGTSSSDGGDGGGGGSGGSSSDGSDDDFDHSCKGCGDTGEVITTPIIDEEIQETEEDCIKLKNLISKSVTNQLPRKEVGTLLNQLQDSSSTTTKEMGYFLNPTDTTESQFIPSYFEGEENADEVAMDLGTNAVSVLMHLHYNNETENKKQLSVFSLQDIYEMYQFIGTGHIFSPNTFTNFLTTEHGTNYAIQINDSNAFVNSSFAIKYFIGWEFSNFREEAENQYGAKRYNILPDKTNGQNELAFTKFLANENLGLTLFRANDDFTEFTKIEYKNGTFKETPCN
ncbi:hypothetical protein [Mangrovimonas spongiae]|uniref:Uncharacterized protein n=1 Tax=Mangrovimonas spongiae TaxID=2494697 RepID=A0A3R9MGS4_9FLAO|nr:hypothetical protein [Mangrovimonas spongiae]RSK41772.1 hypothetical protein EJA19_02515 [Mangrovimonas spongiae]